MNERPKIWKDFILIPSFLLAASLATGIGGVASAANVKNQWRGFTASVGEIR